MHSRRRTPTLFLGIGLLVVAAVGAEEPPPPPFTAEQIRDAFQEGLRIVTRTWTPAGESVSRMIVESRSAEGATLSDQPLDDGGRPVGDKTAGEATWADLRDHAAFPPGTARRERHVEFSALGRLEGWLYTVESGDGGRTLFFFADEHPGPPVVYEKFQEGELVYRAEQIERRGAATPAAASALDRLPPAALPELPAEARRRLEHAIGSWQVRAEQLDGEGNVVRTREWRNHAEWLLPGRMVLLTHDSAHLGSVSKALMFYSLDEETWYLIDVNQNGERWVLTGDLEREVLVSKPRPLPDGREIVVRFSHENVQADSFEALQEVSFDLGESWLTTGRQYLTRIR